MLGKKETLRLCGIKLWNIQEKYWDIEKYDWNTETQYWNTKIFRNYIIILIHWDIRLRVLTHQIIHLSSNKKGVNIPWYWVGTLIVMKNLLTPKPCSNFFGHPKIMYQPWQPMKHTRFSNENVPGAHGVFCQKSSC